MKGLKKLLAVTLTAVLAAGALAGCGGGADEQAAGSSGGKTVINWWTFQNHDADYMQELIDKYNETNTDNIEIKYSILTSSTFRDSLESAFQSNQAPDIFTGQDLAKYYVERGQAEPLNDFLTDEMKERYGDMLYIEGDNAVDGKIYSLPNTGITYRLVYNKALFEKAGIAEPPKTLDEMVEDAKLITEAGKEDKAYGFAINLKDTQTAYARTIATVGMVSGFTIYDYKNGRFDFTPFKPILQAYKQIVEDGSMFPGYESLDIGPIRTQFAQGKIGMYISGSWEPGVYTETTPVMEWAAAPIPTIDGEVKGPSYISGLRWLYISSKSKNKDAAWKVFEAFNNDEVERGYQERGYGNSVVPSVVATAGKPEMAGMEYFLKTDNDRKWPYRPQEKNLTLDGEKFNDIFAAVIMGKTDFDKVVSDMNKRYNAALDAAIAAGTEKEEKIPDFDPMTLIE